MPRRFLPVLAAITAVLSFNAAIHAGGNLTLVDESFADNPISAARATVDGDGSRFTYVGGALTAAYDTGESTTALHWSLGKTLTDNDTFRVTVEFTIDGGSLFADPDNFAQLAFGLVNSVTTGPDRAGGTFNDTLGAYDIVTVDYFPNTGAFGGPTLTPTVVVNNATQYLADFSDPFNPGAIRFPQYAESDLTAEGPLPLDVAITAVLAYDAVTRTLTLTMSDANGPLAVNAFGDGGPGGPDGDVATIEMALAGGDSFAVDNFALLLWEDTFAFPSGLTTTAADVAFTRVLVEQTLAVPEPASIALLGLTLLTRVRRHRHG